MAKEF